MADRDYAAFTTYIADEAIFFAGPAPLRGKQAVAENWKRFYEKPDAPFSWGPDSVEVLDSGTLAISSGPVRDPAGKTFAMFFSIWRLEAPGVWRIIFDKGTTVCDCAKPRMVGIRSSASSLRNSVLSVLPMWLFGRLSTKR